MSQNSSFNQSGASSAPNSTMYNNGTWNQNNNQVSQRPNDASGSATTHANQETTQPAKTADVTERTNWVRFNTICNKELVNKSNLKKTLTNCISTK